MDMQGACLCGAVRFTVPEPSLWAAHCHCTMCQRAHGAGFVTWLGTRAASSVIEDSEQQLRWHASSAEAERGFCGRCGSSLFFRSSRWPGELHVSYANLSTAADRAPQSHVNFDSHQPWMPVDDTLPKKPANG